MVHQTKIMFAIRWVFSVCFLLMMISMFLLVLQDPELSEVQPSEDEDLSAFTKISYESMYHENWIVINTVPEDQSVTFAMSKVKGWKTVITGRDQIKPIHCKLPHCVYLTPSVIRNINGHFIPDIHPEDHTKIYGYLYAIKHGAKNILSVSPEVHYLGNLDRFIFKTKESGLLYYERKVFDPILFTKNVTQRTRRSAKNRVESYPLDFLLKDEMFPVLQVPLYPCRKFRYDSDGELKYVQDPNIQQRKSLAPLFVGSKVYAKLDFRVGLFRYESFWALFLNLVKLTNSMDEVSLSFLIQKLFHDLDFHVAFIPFKPCLEQYSNETQVPLRKGVYKRVIKYLNQRPCVELNLFDCFKNIAREMAADEIFDSDSVVKLRLWLKALTEVDYKEPPMTKLVKSREAIRDIPVIMSSQLYSEHVQDFQNNFSTTIVNITRAPDICPNLDMTWQAPVIDDVMLVVTYNEYKFYGNSLFVELMYRRYFKYIVVCGPFPAEYFKIVEQNNNLTTFFYIEGLTEGWYYMYECTQYALMMNFQIKGVLQIGDDTLVNAWNIFRLPRDQLIIPNIMSVYNRSSEKKEWFWWNLDVGRKALNKVFANLEADDRFEGNALAKQFLANYKTNVEKTEYGFYRGGDLFYTPTRLKDMFIYVTKMCYRHRLMDEVAIPTIFMGFDKSDNIFRIKDGSLWRPTARAAYYMFFDVNQFFIHPFKLSSLSTENTENTFFCKKYMATSLSRLKHGMFDAYKPLHNIGLVWNDVIGGPRIPGELMVH